MKKLVILLVYIFFCFGFSFSVQSQPSEFSLLESGNKSMIVGFELPDYKLNARTTGTNTFIQIYAENSAPMLQAEAPELPYYTFSIHAPQAADLSIEVLERDTVIYHIDHPIIPSRGNLTRDIDPGTVPFTMGKLYQMDQYFPDQLIKSGIPFCIRTISGRTIRINPFAYNPITEELEITTRLVLRITLEDMKSFTHEQIRVPREFNQIYRRMFINYPEAKLYDPLDEEGSMLIICYDPWVDEMEEFVAWKNQRGLATEIFAVSAVGNTASEIKTFISEYYDAHDLAYLLLVGDDIHIPPITNGVAGDSDNAYGYLEGNDHYPDIFVGRFSARNPTDVLTQVERTLDYEKGLLDDFDWIDKSMGIASQQGPGDDNEYDYQHIRNLQEQLVDYTYEEPYYEFYDGSQGGYDATGNPSSQIIVDGVNNGAGVIWYCGHGESTSWTTGNFDNNDVLSLTNTKKLPFVISTACLVGNFAGGDSSCFAEMWMKARYNDQPVGSVANFMSSITQPWNPPMEAQDEMVNILTEMDLTNRKYSFGGLVINGCFSMNEVYGSLGWDVTDTWVLFGDPSLLLRTDVPSDLTVNHPEYLLEGAGEVTINCNIDDAQVTLSKNNEIVSSGIVSGGSVTLSVGAFPAGTYLTITVHSYNSIPYQGTLLISSEEPLVWLSSYSINGETALTYNETQTIDLTLQNIGINVANGVTATLASYDPAVVSITSNQNIGFGNINGSGGTATSSGDFLVTVNDQVENMAEIAFDLEVNTGSLLWIYEVLIPVNAPDLDFQKTILEDPSSPPVFITNPSTYVQQGTNYFYESSVMQEAGNNDSNMDAGETLNLYIPVNNAGNASIQTLPVTLESTGNQVSVANSQFIIDQIEPGETGYAVFEVSIDANCPVGETVLFDMEVEGGFYGIFQSVPFYVGRVDDMFESQDFQTIGWQFPGDPWLITSEGYDSSFGVHSPQIDNSTSTEFMVNADVLVDDTVSFWFKVSSELGCDEFVFKIDDQEMCLYSGELDWQQISFPVPAGNHSFTWKYQKDFIFSSGEDRVILDNISLPPFANERTSIRFGASVLPDWLNIEDQYTGTALITGQAPMNVGFDDVEIVALHNNQSTTQSFTIEIGTVNTRNIDMKQLEVSPNPFTQSVNIDIGQNDEFTLVVSNMRGKVIYLRTFPNNQRNINLEQLPSGMYIFKVISGGNSVEKKIIKL